MVTEGLAGVGEESPESGKTTESTSDSCDQPHHGVELDEGNSKVVSVCTGSARFRRKSSPEVRRNLVDAKVGEGLWELGLSKRNEVGGIGKRTPRRSSGAIYWPRLSPILFSLFSNFGN
jgi:hypothetical protein